MTRLKRICVFCGSGPGKNPKFLQAARALGATLVRHQIGLVYGGAGVGLMGAIADAVLERGGEVIGVIPRDLVKKELAHKNLKDLRVVGSMHERKSLMERLSDGFIALPGGFGTLDELCEILTWAQLNFHSKPCGMLNVEGYFDKFLDFLDQAVSEDFIFRQNRSLLLTATTPEKMLDILKRYRPAPGRRWIKKV